MLDGAARAATVSVVLSRRLLLAAACLVAVAGCEARADTTLHVDGENVRITAVVTLSGEAAVAARQDGADDDIREAFEARAGIPAAEVERDEDDETITYAADLTYEQLVAASDVLGVASASLVADEGTSTLTVALVPPTKLAASLRETAAAQPDPAAVADALLGSVEVGVSVSFAGGVQEATFEPAPNALDTNAQLVEDPDGSVRVRQSVSRFAGGKLTVVGDPSASRHIPWGTVIVGALGVGAALWWAQQLDRRNKARHRLGL